MREIRPVSAKDIAHLHSWRWTREPDGIYGLWDGVDFMSACHCFDLQVDTGEGEFEACGVRATATEPLPFCGLGGISTEPAARGLGYATELLSGILKDITPHVQGCLLNGRPGPGLWSRLGFIDIGPSPTVSDQRLWMLPQPGFKLLGPFEVLPKGFHW